MPIYDYVCSSCGHRAEILHGVHDEQPRACERCGGQMRKAFAAPAIVFKGTGWAKVERRSAGRSKASSEGEGGSSSSGAGGPSSAGDDGTAGSSGDSPRTTEGSTSARAGSGGGSTAAG